MAKHVDSYLRAQGNPDMAVSEMGACLPSSSKGKLELDVLLWRRRRLAFIMWLKWRQQSERTKREREEERD